MNKNKKTKIQYSVFSRCLYGPRWRQQSAPELGGGGGRRGRGQRGADEGPGQLARPRQDHSGADPGGRGGQGETRLDGWAADIREAELRQPGVPDRQGGARRGENES